MPDSHEGALPHFPAPWRPTVQDDPSEPVPVVCGLVSGVVSFGDVPFCSHRCLYIDMTTTTVPSISNSDDSTRPLLVDVAKAAKILAISRSSVYQLIWNEQLTPVRIGRSVRFSIAQLEQFVADRIAECDGHVRGAVKG